VYHTEGSGIGGVGAPLAQATPSAARRVREGSGGARHALGRPRSVIGHALAHTHTHSTTRAHTHARTQTHLWAVHALKLSLRVRELSLGAGHTPELSLQTPTFHLWNIKLSPEKDAQNREFVSENPCEIQEIRGQLFLLGKAIQCENGVKTVDLFSPCVWVRALGMGGPYKLVPYKSNTRVE